MLFNGYLLKSEFLCLDRLVGVLSTNFKVGKKSKYILFISGVLPFQAICCMYTDYFTFDPSVVFKYNG